MTPRSQSLSNHTVTLQKYSVITTDFSSGEQNYTTNTKVKNEKDQCSQFESLKDQENINNNINDTDSIDGNCSSCRTDTKTAKNTMTTNNNTKVSQIV